MDWPTFFKIMVAAIGFGAAGEGIRRYRSWKAERLTIPTHVRNAGFWTDRRIIRAEAVVACLLLATPWTAITLAIATNYSLWMTFAGLLSYPAAIYLFMRGLRAQLP